VAARSGLPPLDQAATGQAAVANPFLSKPLIVAPVAKPAPEPLQPGQIGVSGPAELETGGILTIDLAAIVKNW